MYDFGEFRFSKLAIWPHFAFFGTRDRLIKWQITRKRWGIWHQNVLRMYSKPPIGTLGALKILGQGGPEPPKLGGQKSEMFRFHWRWFFLGVSDNFQRFWKKHFFGSHFGLDLENFRKKNSLQKRVQNRFLSYLPQWYVYQWESAWYKFFPDPIKNGRMAAILVAKNALFGP